MRFLIMPVLIILLFMGCGKSDQQTMQSQGSAIPAAAATMNTKLTSGMTSHMSRVVRYEGFLVGIFNPGTPLAQGVTMSPDTSPGAPPNTFTFSGLYDGNDDGIKETTLTGKVTFNTDPNVGWSGMTGQISLDVNIPFVGHVYHADINFSITSAQRQISGSGTFFDPVTGNTTTMTVDPATPLVIKTATGAPGAISNDCGYSLDGPVGVQVAGPTGTLQSTWNFSSNSATVVVNNRSFTDASAMTTQLPDTTVTTPCGGGGSINDWVDTFEQDWACLPRETGKARLTLTATGAMSVSISDEDPPGSGSPSVYSAATIGANPHALRGFFIAGPVGTRYQEDFNWTMRGSLSGFAQSSTYQYIEGPNIGTGGICVGSAPRM